jgi:hypothetical protein
MSCEIKNHWSEIQHGGRKILLSQVCSPSRFLDLTTYG